ncbi:hypothetical protein SAMN05421841_1838 [Chryseobacterium wanjuense]|uniref:Uncharacterized protein n=1 Tax=Chryseobacterium wanjuense TaxID=356305 RepID=A0A1I0QDV3_9FLAO|nr:hypothetical protein [Chryseobacterium wanjuense]SEW25166.1 hypothetical protein SAMN05421841_1838 [Chryseobacterium wanjuense]
MKLLFLIVFTLTFNGIQAQKKRSLTNPNDRKYFYEQLKKIWEGTEALGSNTIQDKNDKLTSDTFPLILDITSPKPIEVDHHFEEFGAHLAYLFWAQLLKDFSQFQFFSLQLTDQRGQKTSLTFHYLGKKELEYYSRLQQQVVKIKFNEVK